MASSTTAAAASSTVDGVGGHQQVITTEVPEILKRLTLLIVKSFYSKEHCVVADYIQRNVCVKEDKLREFLKVDQKYLRQLLITLKWPAEDYVTSNTINMLPAEVYFNIIQFSTVLDCRNMFFVSRKMSVLTTAHVRNLPRHQVARIMNSGMSIINQIRSALDPVSGRSLVQLLIRGLAVEELLSLSAEDLLALPRDVFLKMYDKINGSLPNKVVYKFE